MNHRTVLAITLPADQVPFVQALQQRLVPFGAVQLLEPTEMFIVLNYLGRLDGDTLSRLKGRTIPKTLHQFSPFQLELRFVDTMYKRGEPSYIFLSPAQGLPELKDLQQACTDMLNELGNHQPYRYQPELIIAYAPKSDPESTKTLLGNISDADLPGLVSFEVSKISLLEISSSKSGEHYQRFAEFILG